MNCACLMAENGRISMCGAHSNETHRRTAELSSKLESAQAEVGRQAIEIRDLRMCLDDGMKTSLEVEKQRDDALLQLAGMKGERDNEQEIAVGWEKKCELLELQVEAMRPVVEAAVNLIKYHGSGATNVKGDLYQRLFSEAGNYHLRSAKNRLDACTCPHHEKAPHLTSCRCCSGKVNDS